MADWTKPMQQSFEYYVVDPNTWKDSKLINTVKSCTVNRDSEVDTLGSATIDIVDSVGECYIRAYLITIQNGVTEKHPLGTFLVQTPSSSYDGKTRNVSMDAYTPLLELKEKQPDLGYYVPKTIYYRVEKNGDNFVKTDEKIDPPFGNVAEGLVTTTGEQVFKEFDSDSYYCIPDTVMALAYRLLRDKKLMRAPVIETECFNPLYYDYVAETDDTWFSFIKDLIANANYEFTLDELGRVLFAPKTDANSLRPIWTYNDDNSSILYPEMTMNHDLYGIPNVVEVVYSTGNTILCATAKNEDVNSPTSIVNRGREITYRVTDPELVGVPTQAQVQDYADRLLRELSTIEYTITYSHGYCPVRLGDCVRLNYERAGIKNIKAKVISQSIKCETGCKVTEKAIFTTKLWR
jgi:hypothetical protein